MYLNIVLKKKKKAKEPFDPNSKKYKTISHANIMLIKGL